jgi:hypothetical protein
VVLTQAPPALREVLGSELAVGPLAASFYALSSGAATAGPRVLVQRGSELDIDVELCAAVGGSDAARHAVFQLVQALLAHSQRVRVCFLPQGACSGEARP